MSCNLNTIAHMEVPVDLQRWLCPHLTFSTSSTPGQSQPFDAFAESTWSDSWGSWDPPDDTDAGGTDATSHRTAANATQLCNDSEQCWLSECLLSVSPAGDVMAVAREDRLCVLTGVWEVPEDEEERLVLKPSWKGVLNPKAGVISSVLCLPVASLQRSSAGAPDFTSILVCHQSGAVCCYTQTGVLLLQKQFEEPGVSVLSAEIRSGTRDGSECLALLYPRCIVTIDTTQITTLLRMCINKLAKASAGGEGGGIPQQQHNSPLPYKKWQLPGSSSAARVVSIAGPIKDSLYDAMAQASLSQAPYNRDATVAAMNSGGVSLMTGGSDPYVSVVAGREVQAAVHVSHVAKQLASAVTSKMLGAASAWIPFVGTKAADDTVQDKPQPGVSVPYRWCLSEGRRSASSVSVSPDPRLAAVTDNFGRIVLFDVRAGYALRMWKGYRDAVVGWVSVSGVWNAAGGAGSSGAVPDVSRRALFLVVHAPRRGLLEVWPAQHGSRLAAFNVPKQARLVYTSYGLLGSRAATSSGGAEDNSRVYSLVLLCPDGAMQQLTVPFHLMLGGRTGKRARDLHLFKSFKNAVKRGQVDEARELATQLQTTAVRLQLLSFLAYCSCTYNQKLIASVLTDMMPLYHVHDDGSPLPGSSKCSSPEVSSDDRSGTPTATATNDPPQDYLKDKDSHKVQQLLKKLSQLLKLYNVVYAMHPKTEEKAQDLDATSPQDIVKELCVRLSLSQSQLDKLVQDTDRPHHSATKVTFSKDDMPRIRVNVAWFLRSFELGACKEKPQEQLTSAQLVLKDLEARRVQRVRRPDLSSMMSERKKMDKYLKKESSEPEEAKELRDILAVPVHEQLSSDRKTALCRFLFGWPWSRCRATALHKAFLDSGVDSKALMKLLLLYWTNQTIDEDPAMMQQQASAINSVLGKTLSSAQTINNNKASGNTSVETASSEQTISHSHVGVSSSPDSNLVDSICRHSKADDPVGDSNNAGDSSKASMEMPENVSSSDTVSSVTELSTASIEEQRPFEMTHEKLECMTAILKVATLMASFTSAREGEVQCSSSSELNSSSSWWCSVRTRLASWTRIRRAYLLALACRTLNTTVEARLRRLEERWRQLQEAEEERHRRQINQKPDNYDEKISRPDKADNIEDNAQDEAPKEFAESSSRAATPSAADGSGTSAPLSRSASESSCLLQLDLFSEVYCDVDKCLSDAGRSKILNTLLEWEGCSTETSHWAVLLEQLEKLMPLEKMLNLTLKRWKGEDCDVTVKLLLDKGKGGVSEVVSRWLVKTGLSAEDLCTLTRHVDTHIQYSKRRAMSAENDASLQDDVDEYLAEEVEDTPEKDEELPLLPSDATHWDPDLLAVYESLLPVSVLFPESVCRASLSANLAWEFAAAWQHNTHDTALLQHAANTAATIPNCHVKHGVTVLVWEKWVSSSFRRLSELMERSAGAPSPSQCQAKLRLPRHSLHVFLTAARTLLSTVMESNVKCEVEKARIPNVDRFWQHIIIETSDPGPQEQRDQFSTDSKQKLELQQDDGKSESIYEPVSQPQELHKQRFIDRQGGDGRTDTEPRNTRRRRVCGPKSLVEVAVLQKVTSYDLAFVHTQLADTLRIIAALDMRGVKPHTFFNDRSRCVLHKSLHLQWSIGSVDEASSITTLRIKFLTTAITHAIAGLQDHPTWQEFQKSGADEAIELGRVWGASPDHLYRFQVIELYSFGHDEFAQNCIRLVSQTRQLGQNLLLLAACRYKHLIDTSPRPAPLVTALGGSIAHWIKSLSAEQLKNPIVSVMASMDLLTTVMRLLPPSSSDHAKADSLLYAFTTLHDSAAA